MQISQILDKIDDNQLFVPAFQREYVWKRSDAKKLIASLIREYPTGTMLTWETNNPPELKGRWEHNPNQGAIKLILDGQQRITTLYMLVRGEIPPYYEQKEIIQDTRGLHVNVETLELQYYTKVLMSGNPLWVDLTAIFQQKITAWEIAKKEDISDERKQTIFENFQKISLILNREFVEQTIPIRASIREAIDIFYVVNASGVSLSGAELALAQICGYWPGARDAFKKKLFDLASKGFVLKLDFLVYVMLGVMHNVGSDLRKLHTPDNYPQIEEAWKQLDQHTLDYVVDLLKSHAYVDHTKEINSVYALIPIVVYCFNNGATPLSQEEIRKIIKWFYYAQIRQRYNSQTTTKLDKDIDIIATSEIPFDALLNNIGSERTLFISAEEFAGADTKSALWSMMRWYFKSRNAVCITTGLSIRKDMNKKYTLTWDHIFQASLLKKNGYGQENRIERATMKEIANRLVLLETTTRSKNTKDAKGYLAEVQSKFPDALGKQLIPPDSELWAVENFEQFLIERRQMLAQELNTFLENITKTSISKVETSIEDLIAEGESIDLEFKSSLRWCYNNSMINKKLEAVIMKSIAAFSNNEGGTLLIGVNDEGEVLGLENDYATLNGNRDEFELHLRNLIVRNFNAGFSVRCLTVSFPKLEEKEICKIDVKRGLQPQCDKNGQKSEKFYIRNGNASIALTLEETARYIPSRFS